MIHDLHGSVAAGGNPTLTSTNPTGTGHTVMVGDNPVADVEGARSAGLEAHLVRRTDDRYPSHPDLGSLVASLIDRPGES